MIKKFWTAFITKQYQRTSDYQLDMLNCINLERPQFYMPTADASHLVDWNRIFADHVLRGLPHDLLEPLSLIVEEEIESIQHFDLKKIQSLTASKSFGSGDCKINGSWFQDVCSWGGGMYPSDNFGAMHETDWERNIRHLERDAFSRESPIYVEHLTWLNRYVASQAGGSHHTALVIHQMTTQNRQYYREAKCSNLRINMKYMEQISKNYYSFITHKKLFSSKLYNSTIETSYIFKSETFNDVYSLDMRGSVHNAIIVFLPKREIKINKDIFEQWLNARVKAGLIIPLTDMLANTLKYCSTPYTHFVRDICLGDPMRRYETQARTQDLSS